jgi:hypothetical protein
MLEESCGPLGEDDLAVLRAHRVLSNIAACFAG